MTRLAPLRLLLPGTLCDPRLFAPMGAHWASLGLTPRDSLALDLSDLDEPQAWWHRQLPALPEQFDLVGFSLGGVLALALLRLAPTRVRRLALVSANSQGGTPGHEARVHGLISQWHSQGPTAVARHMAQQAIPAGACTASMIERLEAMAEATPEAAFMAQCHLNATRPDSRETLARWPGQLLLLCGEQDPWCGPSAQALALERRMDARYISLAGAGHYLPLERPEALAAALDAFFRAETP